MTSIRPTMQPLEVSLLEANIARLVSEQGQEYVRIVTGYLSVATSSNRLYLAHCSNLGKIAGARVLTNNATAPAQDRDLMSQIAGLPAVLITVSSNWLATASSNGACKELTDQLRVVTRVCSQGCWSATIQISPLPVETVLRIGVYQHGGSLLSPDRQFAYTGQALFRGSDEQRLCASEAVVLDALNSVPSTVTSQGPRGGAVK
ncbi:MAG TPA: hypothetical protein VJA21_33320 [Verrucomicrobiae bacterium]